MGGFHDKKEESVMVLIYIGVQMSFGWIYGGFPLWAVYGWQ